MTNAIYGDLLNLYLYSKLIFLCWIGDTEEERLKADKNFLKTMFRDCCRAKNRISRSGYIAWSYFYFWGCVLWGGNLFTMLIELRTEADLAKFIFSTLPKRLCCQWSG
ncbi:MAG: hypothetical protein HQK65_01425 [Desulfamplus sp.]|nr:hypothetical protein [Desulfamplus sp.]